MKTIFSTGLFCLILSSGAPLQAQNTFPATGRVSLGSTLSNSKLALWDNGSGSVRYGLGIQGGQFRLHLGHTSARFSFLSDEAGTELMTLTGNGNLGIGTITPTAPLSLGSTLGNSKLALWDNGSGSVRYGFGIQDDQFRLHLGHPSAKFSFFNAEAGTEVMTLTGAGNLGIGTATPTASLDVVRGSGVIGTARFSGTDYASLFNNGTAENTYIRGGKTGAIVLINDSHNGHVNIAAGGGNVGIGTEDTKGYKLGVNGSAIATSMTVKLHANWPDFVFAKTYGLRSLAEVESYIQAHAHLPEVPSAAQVAKEGINLGEMDATLLKKIEELTLYLIEQNKEMVAVKRQLQELKTENKEWKAAVISNSKNK